MAEKIVIAEKLYVGYDERHETYQGEKTKLGFATYYEDNAACRKRQGTIDFWSGKTKEKWPPEILDNAPLTGFKLSKKVTHGGGWNDLTVHWRIVDPRGFELEISSGNLAKLFQYCTIDHGTIAEACVYGFDKGNQSKVVLLPVNSEIYLDSVKSTEVHNAKKISLKDVPIGSLVELKSGVKGTYLGRPHVAYCEITQKNSDQNLALRVGQYHVVEMKVPKHAGKSKKTQLFLFATPNFIKAEKGKALYPVDLEKYLNTNLSSGSVVIEAASSSSRRSLHRAFAFSYDKITGADLSFAREDIDAEHFLMRLHQERLSDRDGYSYYTSAGKFGLIVAEVSEEFRGFNRGGSQGEVFIWLAAYAYDHANRNKALKDQLASVSCNSEVTTEDGPMIKWSIEKYNVYSDAAIHQKFSVSIGNLKNFKELRAKLKDQTYRLRHHSLYD